jgi:hypothetical protein
MTALDLASTSTRILECSKCDEPVAGDRASGAVTFACSRCGASEVREIAPRRLAEVVAAKPGRLLRVDLDAPLDGLPRDAGTARLVAAWRDAKAKVKAASEDERAAAELALLWLGATLGERRVAAGDHARARATLETVLESLTIPPYRAIALARLACLAAAGGAPALADRWLEACPRTLAVPEVSGEIRAAEAMVARARGDANEVLRVLREGEIVGAARGLAAALRADAHEANGDAALARAAWREATRGGSKDASRARVYGLAARTRRLAAATSVAGVAGLFSVGYGFVALLSRCTNDVPIGVAPLAALVVGFALASLLTRL